MKNIFVYNAGPWSIAAWINSKEQPRRQTDLYLTEAVGHFHLYAWLKEALSDLAVVSPEFPTGNGQVDLHIRHGEQVGLIEVKSFKSATTLNKDRASSRLCQQFGVGPGYAGRFYSCGR